MDLKIAEFLIRLTAGKAIQVEEGYLPFVVENELKEPDVTIECFSGIPDYLFQGGNLLFEARNDEQQYYSIFKNSDNLIFRIYDQQSTDTIQQTAILNEDFTHWKIYLPEEADQLFSPLKYPMGPILMYYMTVKNNAIMIHASGIFDGKKGRIFSGFSGSGKSTISEIWKKSGSKVINDDRLIIRKMGTGYTMFNTPMYYEDFPKSSQIDTIHLINHAKENFTKKISGAKAVSGILAFCIQNNYDKQFIENHLSFIHELCLAASVYETGFLPDKEIVDYIREHEN